MDDWDEYQPAQAIRCSWCDARLGLWRGWDGPVRRLVWREGERYPARVRDGGEVPADCSHQVLPAAFVISARCDAGHVQHANCTATDEVWTDTVRIAEQLAYGEYQPDDVLDYGLPSVDPLAIGPGEATPLAVLIAGQLGAVLYLSRRSPYDSVEESDVDWLWEIELYQRSSDGGWGDGDWNYDPWPDPNIELERNGPVMLLSDLRGIVTTEKAQYVIGGMASAGVHAVEISNDDRSSPGRRQPQPRLPPRAS